MLNVVKDVVQDFISLLNDELRPVLYRHFQLTLKLFNIYDYIFYLCVAEKKAHPSNVKICDAEKNIYLSSDNNSFIMNVNNVLYNELRSVLNKQSKFDIFKLFNGDGELCDTVKGTKDLQNSEGQKSSQQTLQTKV